MENNQLLLGQVAKLLCVKPYTIGYAITCGLVPEPEQRINNHRLFTPQDVKNLKQYFANRPRGQKETNDR